MRVLLEAYGCTLNKGEAMELRDMLESKGAVVTADEKGADVAVVFTCIVIDATEKQMVRRVTELAVDVGRVHVLGCLPPTLPHLLEDIEGVTMWDLSERAEAASAIMGGKGAKVVPPPKPRSPSPAKDDVTTPFPISSGCLGKCAYCLTKRARGDLLSRSPDGLSRRFDELYARGYREFRLTSQDSGVYGADIATDLNSLLDTLLAKEGDFRLRVGMMNPLSLRRIMPGYLEHIVDGRVYRFLHLPFQSGSDRILGLMNRGYRAEEALELVGLVRASVPDLTVSTDIITGFPTETEEDLEATLSLAEKMEPSIVNVTRFSPRPGTAAMRMDGQLSGSQSKEFSRIASERTRAMVESKLRSYEGRTMRAFTVAMEPGLTVARTDNYLVVRLKGEMRLGQSLEVQLGELDVVSFKGRVVRPLPPQL